MALASSGSPRAKKKPCAASLMPDDPTLREALKEAQDGGDVIDTDEAAPGDPFSYGNFAQGSWFDPNAVGCFDPKNSFQ